MGAYERQVEREWAKRLEDLGFDECETCWAIVRRGHLDRHEHVHEQEQWRRMGDDL